MEEMEYQPNVFLPNYDRLRIPEQQQVYNFAFDLLPEIRQQARVPFSILYEQLTPKQQKKVYEQASEIVAKSTLNQLQSNMKNLKRISASQGSILKDMAELEEIPAVH